MRMPNMKDEELGIMARTIFGEARGEPTEGRVAIGHVILNRWLAKSWYGDGIASVCLKPWQFSCWNENDPNRAKLNNMQMSSNRDFRECVRNALQAFDETDKGIDPTFGATHYHAENISPSWAQGRVAIAIIGHHIFYNNVD